MIGKTISHYLISEKLGAGGMGVVYKAEDTTLHRMVALKFLPPNLIGTQRDMARFLVEARAAAILTGAQRRGQPGTASPGGNSPSRRFAAGTGPDPHGPSPTLFQLPSRARRGSTRSARVS